MDERFHVDKKQVYRRHLRLKPTQVYEKTFPWVAEKGQLKIELAEKLSYLNDPCATVLERPFNFHEFDEEIERAKQPDYASRYDDFDLDIHESKPSIAPVGWAA